jgi:hypothetical protein
LAPEPALVLELALVSVPVLEPELVPVPGPVLEPVPGLELVLLWRRHLPNPLTSLLPAGTQTAFEVFCFSRFLLILKFCKKWRFFNSCSAIHLLLPVISCKESCDF